MNLRPSLSDDERFPLIPHRAFLDELRQGKFSPKYNFRSGDRITGKTMHCIKEYVQSCASRSFWSEGETPGWVQEYLDQCRTTVPFYRDYADSFEQVPSITRSDIAQAPWKFVSDSCSLDDLLVYSTSGTTGVPMDVLFDAASQAAWIPQLESILIRDEIRIEGGPDRVSICLVCSQESTLTYASLSTYLGGAGVLKINLNPADWSDPADRIRYLERHNPEIITGDPFTFTDLAVLAPNIHPKAMVSSAMTLHDGLRHTLQNQFGCPVYDLYSLTECRMIAVSKSAGVHRLIRPELYIELLDPQNRTVPLGERGEITVTGGINPFLPLIRYRTGDYASMRCTESGIELIDLEGREPAVLANSEGEFINSVDISRALMPFELAGFTLHQRSDRSVTGRFWSETADLKEIETVLADHFGSLPLTLEKASGQTSRKPIRYTSELSREELL